MLNLVIQKALSFTKKEDGATAIEYGLIAASIAVVIIVAVQLVGTNLTGIFNTIAGDLSN
jgi:pilus assembly protein Flp/PilA